MLYSIIEPLQFLNEVAEITGSIARWDEIREAILLDLPRNPRIGQSIPGTKLFAILILSTPFLTLYYQIDDTAGTITLIELRKES